MISEAPPLVFVVDMKHLAEDDRTRKHRIASCRKGRHDFGDQQDIGGGIARRVCAACSAVSIDLTPGAHLKPPAVQPLPATSVPAPKGS